MVFYNERLTQLDTRIDTPSSLLRRTGGTECWL